MNFIFILRSIEPPTHHPLFSVSQALLPYTSNLVWLMKTLFYALFYIFNYSDERRTLIVEMFSKLTDNPYRPSTVSSIIVHSKHIEINAATVDITAHIDGIRYYMYYWPVTSLLAGILFNMTWILSFVALLYFSRRKDDSDAGSTTHGWLFLSFCTQNCLCRQKNVFFAYVRFHILRQRALPQG